jgi:hypothetical protein
MNVRNHEHRTPGETDPGESKQDSTDSLDESLFQEGVWFEVSDTEKKLLLAGCRRVVH